MPIRKPIAHLPDAAAASPVKHHSAIAQVVDALLSRRVTCYQF
jgi:hypothetical protein